VTSSPPRRHVDDVIAGWALRGACVNDCWTVVVVFAVALFVPSLIRALGHVPSTVVNFRYAI